jgi:large subunit ribosomal protein L24
MKLTRGDEVKVLRGKDKGKTGKIEKIFTRENLILIPNINLYKRHLKSRSQRNPSEIKTLTKPISVSNVKLICPKCKLPTTIGYSIKGDKKERICKKCKQAI